MSNKSKVEWVARQKKKSINKISINQDSIDKINNILFFTSTESKGDRDFKFYPDKAMSIGGMRK